MKQVSTESSEIALCLFKQEFEKVCIAQSLDCTLEPFTALRNIKERAKNCGNPNCDEELYHL